MSEATDLSTIEEQATEAPVEQLGDGLRSDTPLGALDEPTESDEGVQESPEPTNNDTIDADERHKGYLRQSDYTKGKQEIAREREALQAERAAWEQQIAYAQAQAPVEGGGENSSASQYVQLAAQALQQPDLSPEDRAGLNTIYAMAYEMEKTQAELGRLQQLEAQFQQTQQDVLQLSDAQLQTQTKAIQGQIDEAKEIFGEESVSLSSDFIRRNFGDTNPVTGAEFTVAELVGLATNKTAEEAAGARGRTQATRQRLKQGIAGSAQPSAAPNGKGKLSRDEAIAEIKANMVGSV